MGAYQRKLQNLKILRAVLIQVSVVWFLYGCFFLHWERPLACTTAFLVAVANMTLSLSYRRSGQKSVAVLIANWALTSSAAGLAILSLLSEAQPAPFLWLLAALPAYGFCFLPLGQAFLWTGLSAALIFVLNFINSYLAKPVEFHVGPWENATYQLLMVFLVTLISAVVKELSVKHVQAVKKAKFDAELASAARTRFTTHVSHEMRHPLQSIIGALELAESDGLTPDQRSLFQQARDDADLLSNLVDSTLLFAELCQGKFASNLESVTLEQIERSTVARFRKRFSDRDVLLSVNHSEASLETERTSVEYLLSVFLDNALKYTRPQDRVQVDMQVNSDLLKVSVSDSGEGIPNHVLDQLHEPFHRGTEVQDRTVRGFGMGLAIVHRLTDALHGRWGVESNLGDGSHFWFEVPCSLISDPSSRIPSLKILVVDDDQTCLKITRRLLEKLGHQVVTTNQAHAAPTLATEDDFDLVFMDCNMPGTDGFEATRLLRQSGFTNPIVALTANTSTDDREKCEGSGMSGVVAKPATQSKLSRALRDFSDQMAS